ncbi:MAG TPA: hypothetical protein VN669_07610 [Candidatus Acidoferrales bacterium]|nr:hypothetical protein [Candidatus Acidoferrales bacterium]
MREPRVRSFLSRYFQLLRVLGAFADVCAVSPAALYLGALM